jgi:hypothetical protein
MEKITSEKLGCISGKISITLSQPSALLGNIEDCFIVKTVYMLAIVLVVNILIYSVNNQKDGKPICNKKKLFFLHSYKNSDNSLFDLKKL